MKKNIGGIEIIYLYLPAFMIGFVATDTAVTAAPFKGCLSTIASQ